MQRTVQDQGQQEQAAKTTTATRHTHLRVFGGGVGRTNKRLRIELLVLS